MKRLIFSLLLCVFALSSQAQGTFYQLEEISVGTNYDPVTDSYTWTDYTPCAVLMYLSELNVITIYSKQEQMYTILSQEIITPDKMFMVYCVDDMKNYAEILFFTTDNGMYMMIDYPKTVAWSYRLVPVIQ